MSSTLELSTSEVDHQDSIVFNESDEAALAFLKARPKHKNYLRCGVHVDAVLNDMAISDILGESPNAESHRKAVEACLERYSLSGDRLSFISGMTSSGRMVLKERFGVRDLTNTLEAVEEAEVELNRLGVIARAGGKASAFQIAHFTTQRNLAVQHLMFMTRVVG